MTRCSKRSEAGFTLVEMLVSLAILALGAMLLMQGVMAAGMQARRVARDRDAGTGIAAAQLVLRERIGQLLPGARTDLAEPLMDFYGSDRLVEFTAAPPAGAAADAIQRYRLLLTAPGDLVLYRIGTLDDRLDPRQPSTIGWTPAPLLRGAQAITIDYFGRRGAEPQGRWHSVWQQQVRLPELVRIRLSFPAGDRRRWPALVVAPSATLDLSCDPERRTPCRATT